MFRVVKVALLTTGHLNISKIGNLLGRISERNISLNIAVLVGSVVRPVN